MFMSLLERKSASLAQLDSTTTMIGEEKPTKLVVDLSKLSPEINKEEIIFDLSALRRRCRLGGVSQVNLVGVEANQPISSSFEPSRSYPKRYPTAGRWIHVTSVVNIDTLQAQGANNQNPSEVVASAINDVVSKDVFEYGRDNLMGGWFDKFVLTGTTVSGAIFDQSLPTQNVLTVFGSQVLAHIVTNASNLLLFKNDLAAEPNGYRYSLFSGAQLDRAGIASLMQVKECVLGQKKLVRASSQRKANQ